MIPMKDRVAVLQGLRWVDEVIIGEYDGTCCAKTLRDINADIYARGGDRTLGTIPQEEVDACRDVGCSIVYGIGDLLNSSTNILKRVMGTK